MRWTRRSQDDFSDEIRAHLAIETDRLVAEGMPRDEAERAARRAFGNVTAAGERFFESRPLAWLDHLRQDLRTGVSNLARYPVAALVAVLSIGAGIGATTSFLTIRNVVFENPPPLYLEPERLSNIQVAPVDRPIFPVGGFVPGDLFTAWRDAIGVPIAAAAPSRGVRDVRTADRLEAVPVRAVSPGFFALLGVGPEAGRLFDGNGISSQPEAILSYRLWQQWFGGRAEVLGSTIWIEGLAHTVVGVMPAGFWFSDMDSPVWTRLDPDALAAGNEVQVVARRPDGMGHAVLAARLEASLAGYSRRQPPGSRPLQLRVSAVKGTPMGDRMSIALPFMFGASVLLTLLIACANVAILMIAQWTTREAETAVRTALGATRGRIVRALVTESIVLAAAAGALGLAATFALRGILVSRASTDLAYLNLEIDPALFWQAAAITIVTGVIAGIGPALFETRRLQVDPLRGIAAPDRVRQRWSHTLVVLEITVTLALLVVTASMIDGYRRGRNASLGFDADAFLTAVVERDAGVDAAALLDTLSRTPGVDAAAAATALPFAGRGPRLPVAANPDGTGAVRAERIAVSPGFFATLALPVRGGRTFTAADSAATGTAIVNETLAEQLFAGTAIGRRLWIDGTAYAVVAVVAEYASTPIEQRLPQPKVFVPLAGEATLRLGVLVRASGDPAALVQPVRRALQDASSGAVVTRAYTIRQMLNIQGEEMLLGTAPFFPLVLIGMLLTASGIYGVLAFAIARRSRELAVRMAIGASRADQLRLVGAHSARLLASGLACGLALTFALSRLVRAAGGAGSFNDPPWGAFVLPAVIVLLVGGLATWMPARRVLRIDPALLLKIN